MFSTTYHDIRKTRLLVGVVIMTMVLKTKPARTGRFNRGPVPNPVLFFEKTGKIKKRPKIENRQFDRQNREPEQLNRFWPGSPNPKTAPFCQFFFSLTPCPSLSSFSFFGRTTLSASRRRLPPLPHAAVSRSSTSTISRSSTPTVSPLRLHLLSLPRFHGVTV